MTISYYFCKLEHPSDILDSLLSGERKKKRKKMTKYYWLLEQSQTTDNKPIYFYGFTETGQNIWTNHDDMALKFITKEDASIFCEINNLSGWGVLEHGFG